MGTGKQSYVQWNLSPWKADLPLLWPGKYPGGGSCPPDIEALRTTIRQTFSFLIKGLRIGPQSFLLLDSYSVWSLRLQWVTTKPCDKENVMEVTLPSAFKQTVKSAAVSNLVSCVIFFWESQTLTTFKPFYSKPRRRKQTCLEDSQHSDWQPCDWAVLTQIPHS